MDIIDALPRRVAATKIAGKPGRSLWLRPKGAWAQIFVQLTRRPFFTFIDADFGAIELDHCLIQGVAFERCNFSAAGLNGTEFNNCIFRECDFSRASMGRLQSNIATFHSCRFAGTDFVNAQVLRSELVECELAGAVLIGAQFRTTELASCSLRNANLTRSQFVDSSVRECDLSGANLMGADFHWDGTPDRLSSNLVGSRLHDITYDRHTRVPEPWLLNKPGNRFVVD